jgi:hypothetical protein
MLERLDLIVDKMPQSKFIEVSPNSETALISNEEQVVALTINWQWVLVKINEALMTRDNRRVFKLLFSELKYVQLNNNAVEDIRSLVRQTINDNTLSIIQVKFATIEELINEYLAHPQTTESQRNWIINELSFVIEQLKGLEVVGIGAFMLASCLHLAMLQEKALLDLTEWSSVKHWATEYSQYAATVTPKLFRLSVGRIDKACRCIKWEPESEGVERITQYECRYSDSKDIYLFRSINPDTEIECNKHRLQMFCNVVDRINKTAAKPVRKAIREWQELAASI